MISIGFARAFAAKFVLKAAMLAHLAQGELKEMKAYLLVVSRMKAVHAADTSGIADSVHRCLAGKMSATDKQRPDVTQIAYALESWASSKGSELQPANVDEYVKDFNERSAQEGKKITPMELGALHFYLASSTSAKEKNKSHLSQKSKANPH